MTERRGGRRNKMRIVSKAKRLFGDSSSGITRSGYLNYDGDQTLSRTSLASTNSDTTDDPEDTQWNLDACIDILESVNTSGMTPEQQAAFRNLRSASNLINPQGPYRARRDAKFFSFGRRKSSIGAKNRPSPLMTRELLQCFHEVEDNKEDTDQQSNTTAVLATYGGEIFDGVFCFAPSLESKKRATKSYNPKFVAEQAPKLIVPSLPAAASSPLLDTGTQDEPNRRGSERRHGAVNIEAMDFSGSFAKYLTEPDQSSGHKVYCPPEWNALTIQARKELSHLLSWDNLSLWDFDVLVVADLSRLTMNNADDEVEEKKQQFCPLLFIGWAILCAPLAQQAMEGSLGNDCSDPCGKSPGSTTPRSSYPYDFCGDLKIDPDTVCNFLRQVEQGYRFENPYHNNIHAADVTQTLHCLLQLMEPDYADKIYTTFDFFTVLLAATFHDIGHPGTNNLFEMNARTTLAVKYNDNSVLESMHSAVGHSLLLGEEKKEEWDVFKHWDNGQIGRARTIMIKAILATDMSTHFPSVGVLASLVEKVQVEYMEDDTEEEEEPNERKTPLYILSQILAVRETVEENPLKEKCSELANVTLKFLLHAADISNPAKKNKLLVYWADRALAEFFDQGDREVELGIPISPLCDRRTVKRADSQIGFLKFVIRPTYALLGEILPRVKEEVIPIIDRNINYWTREKSRMSLITLTQHPAMGNAMMRAADFEKQNSDIGEEQEEEEEH